MPTTRPTSTPSRPSPWPLALALALAAPAFAPACGDDGGGSGGETPILERTPLLAGSCEVTSPIAQVSGASWLPTGVAQTSTGAFIARGNGGAALVPVDAAGVLGEPLDLGEDEFAYSPIAVAAGAGDFADRVAVVWGHYDEAARATLRVAIVDDGAFSLAPTEIPGFSGAQIGDLAVAVLADGRVAALVGTQSATGAGSLELRVLDASGAVAAGPTTVATAAQSYGYFGVTAVASGDGLLATWVEGYDAGEVKLAAFSPGAGLRLGPIALSGGQGWAVQPWTSLRVVGGETWVAWSEQKYTGSDFDAKGKAEIWVAAIDTKGQVSQGRLAEGEVDTMRTAPRLTEALGRPALAWSEGSFIYICGGCISDYDIHLVALTRDEAGDIVPASAVTTVLHGSNGLYARGVATFGDALLVVASLDFHALSYPGLATVTCTAN